MLQKTFEIHQGKIYNEILHIEIGEAHIAFTAFNENKAASHNFELYEFGRNEDFENIFVQISNQSAFLKNDYKQVKIVWENSFAQYIPAKFFDDNSKDIFSSFFAKNIDKQKELFVKNNEYVISYSVNEARYNFLNNRFSNAGHSHKYFETLSHSSLPATENPLKILIVFFQNHFIISAYKNDKLQLINSVNFTSGTDVVYHLLNTAKQLNTSISDTLVVLSGLIDGDSILFREIYKYIPHIDVDTAENATFLKENFSEHPSHFFVPFFKYA